MLWTGNQNQFILHYEFSVELFVLESERMQRKIELAIVQVREQTFRPFAFHFHTDPRMLIEKRLGEFRNKVKADAFVGADLLPPQPQVADVADRQARLFRKEMDLFENYNADSRGFLILRHDVAEATDVARTVRSARTKLNTVASIT
jgi:hypothetical protein